MGLVVPLPYLFRYSETSTVKSITYRSIATLSSRALICAIAALAASSASAASLPSCSLFAGATLTNLISESCVVGDKLFSNFGSTSATSITNMVTFEPLAAISNDPGVEFNGLTTAAGQSVLFNVSYDVQVLPKNPFLIQAGEFNIPSISFNGSGGSISGLQNYCEGGAGDAESCAADGGSLYSAIVASSLPSTVYSSGVMIPKTIGLAVSTDVTVFGGSAGTFVGSIDQRFAQVAAPEPTTFLMLGTGLLALSRIARKK
jgi:hypothetical protein